MTVNPLRGVEVPVAEVTLKLWSPSDAEESIKIEIATEVSVLGPRISAVTPVPLNVTAVAPLKLEPKMTAAFRVPCTAVKSVIRGVPSMFD